MALIRETWFFSSTGGTRWSEVYYRSRDDLANATFVKTAAHLNRRMALLTPHAQLTKIRYQTVVQPRAAKNVTYNRKGDETAGENPANYTEAAVVNLVSAVGSRKLWLRGISEKAVSRAGDTGLDAPDGAWIDKLKEWFESLKANDYLVLTRKKANWLGDEPRRKKINTIAAGATAGNIVLTLAEEMAVPDSKQLVIGSANPRQFPGLNGVHDIVTGSGTSYTIKYVLPSPTAIPSPGNAYAFKLEYQAIDSMKISHLACSFAYLGGRQTKKLDTGSRGARRVVRRTA